MAGNVFNNPGKVDQETNSLSSNAYANASAKSADNKAKGIAGTKAVDEYARSTKGADLYGDQNVNYAKSGGKFGRPNEKDYSSTLRMARKVDEYNAAPRAHGMLINYKGGTVYDVGTGQTKPQLQTQETRAMDQSWQLDSNRKMLAQQLQAAIDAKDYDSFKQAMTQIYGMTMSDYQMRQAFNNALYNNYLGNLFNKDMTQFNSEWARHFTGDTITKVRDLTYSDPALANTFMSALMGQEGFELSQLASNTDLIERMQRNRQKGMSESDALMHAELEVKANAEDMINAHADKYGKGSKGLRAGDKKYDKMRSKYAPS